MTEMRTCGRCGAQQSTQARFCSTCGQPLPQTGAPAAYRPAGAPAPWTPPGYPPPPFAQFPPAQFGQRAATVYPSAQVQPAAYPAAVQASSARPTGIALLAVTEVVVAVVCLIVVREFLAAADWRFSYDETFWGIVDGAFLLAYLGCSVQGFLVARALWTMRQWSWLRANYLSLALVGTEIVSVGLWGMGTMDLVGFIAQGCVLVYLNMTPTRALFGRGPLVRFTPSGASDATP
jgi:hypothetical protein